MVRARRAMANASGSSVRGNAQLQHHASCSSPRGEVAPQRRRGSDQVDDRRTTQPRSLVDDGGHRRSPTMRPSSPARFNRTLSQYLNTVIAPGFVLKAIEEPPVGGIRRAHPSQRGWRDHAALFLYVRAGSRPLRAARLGPPARGTPPDPRYRGALHQALVASGVERRRAVKVRSGCPR